MKHTWTIVLSLLIAMFFLITTAAYATESVVFVDDDPVNSDGQTFYSGTWTQSTFFPQTYGQGYHFSTTTGGSLTMRATLDIDETGGGADNVSGSQFQAFARWSAGGNRCNAVLVQVRNASTNTTITSETVNQTTQGLQFNWTPIGGRFTATPNQLYEIRFISPGVCVTTADGGMFVQQTYDSSDVFNLTASSIIDEAGVDFSSAGSRTLSSPAVNVCNTYTQLTSVVVTVPPSSSSSYVVCSASGEVDHNQVNNLVRVGIDAVPNTTDTSIPDRSRVLEAISLSSEEDRTPWAMQNVYTFSSAGGSQRYALKTCRQTAANSATLIYDPLVCEMFPTRY